MTTTLNASTSSGLVSTADTSGNLALQSNGTTIATAQSTGLNLAATGLVFSDSTTQTSGYGVAKAWVNFAGNSSSPTVRASYNVSSVTFVSGSIYTINFTTAFPDANYAIVGMGQRDSANTGNLNIYGSSTYNSLTTTSAKVVGYDNANNQVYLLTMCVAVFR